MHNKMAKITIVFFLFILTGCGYKPPVLMDIEGPEFISFFYNKSDIIMQFNEPVINYKLIFGDTGEYKCENKFPVANNYIADTVFLKYQGTGIGNDVCKIETTDTSGNQRSLDVQVPYVTHDPPDLKIAALRLRYGKKKQQFIMFDILNGGDLRGGKLVLFGGRKMQEFILPPLCVNKKKAGLLVNVNYIKNKTYSCSLTQGKNGTLYLNVNWHLSGSAGFVGIYNYRNELNDYILYYDSSEKSFLEYKQSAYYKQLFNYIPMEQQVVTDIRGTTQNKIIVRAVDGDFIVKK